MSDASCNVAMQFRLNNESDVLVEERCKTHQSTLKVTYHYLNNLLNEFQYVLLQLEQKGKVDDDVIRAIKATMNKTILDLRAFENLKNPTSERTDKFIKLNVRSFVRPTRQLFPFLRARMLIDENLRVNQKKYLDTLS